VDTQVGLQDKGPAPVLAPGGPSSSKLTSDLYGAQPSLSKYKLMYSRKAKAQHKTTSSSALDVPPTSISPAAADFLSMVTVSILSPEDSPAMELSPRRGLLRGEVDRQSLSHREGAGVWPNSHLSMTSGLSNQSARTWVSPMTRGESQTKSRTYMLIYSPNPYRLSMWKLLPPYWERYFRRYYRPIPRS
jgi:hypothetical protein